MVCLSSRLVFSSVVRQVTCLTAGRLDLTAPCDVLLVGSAADVRAYNVAENADVFCRDAPDGCSALTVGPLGTPGQGNPAPVVFVGGSCSIYGYDAAGEDAYWTVRGSGETDGQTDSQTWTSRLRQREMTYTEKLRQIDLDRET